MARLISLYIQDDVWDCLDEEGNKSKLINDLLREHYRKLDLASMSVLELKKLRAKEKAKQKYDMELAKIEDEFK